LATLGRVATNQTELSRTAIAELPLMLPSRDVGESFDGIASRIFCQINNLIQQNQKLRAARDLLLPRLISGEFTP